MKPPPSIRVKFLPARCCAGCGRLDYCAAGSLLCAHCLADFGFPVLVERVTGLRLVSPPRVPRRARPEDIIVGPPLRKPLPEPAADKSPAPAPRWAFTWTVKLERL